MRLLFKFKRKVEQPDFNRYRAKHNDRYYTLSIDKKFESSLGGMVVFYERRLVERQTKKGKSVKAEVRTTCRHGCSTFVAFMSQ